MTWYGLFVVPRYVAVVSRLYMPVCVTERHSTLTAGTLHVTLLYENPKN